LLHELLQTAGHSARLAHATLPEADARKLFEQVSNRPVAMSSPPPTPQAQPLTIDADLARRLGSSQSALQERLTRQMEQGKQELDALWKDLESSVKVDQPAARPDDLSDHWWVQLRKGAEWMDLDPTTPDSKLGDRLAEPRETIAPSQLPKSVRHGFDVRVVISVQDGTKIVDVPVLEESLDAADAFTGQRIVLTIAPTAWLKQPPSRSPTQESLSALDEWVPVLTNGSRQKVGKAFSDRGATQAGMAALGPGSGAQRAVGRATSLFGTLPGAPADTVPASTLKELVAARVEYHSRGPGVDASKTSVALFDLLGSPDRKDLPSKVSVTETNRLARALALITEVELLPVSNSLSVEFATHVATRALLANRAPLQHLVGHQAPSSTVEISRAMSQLKGYPDVLYALALQRRSTSLTPRPRADLELLGTRQRMQHSGNGHLEIKRDAFTVRPAAARIARAGVFRLSKSQPITAGNGWASWLSLLSPSAAYAAESAEYLIMVATVAWSLCALWKTQSALGSAAQQGHVGQLSSEEEHNLWIGQASCMIGAGAALVGAVLGMSSLAAVPLGLTALMVDDMLQDAAKGAYEERHKVRGLHGPPPRREEGRGPLPAP
jgi:hypothetical protein